MSEKSVCCAKILKIYRDCFSKSASEKKNLGVFGLDDLAEGEAREFKSETPNQKHRRADPMDKKSSVVRKEEKYFKYGRVEKPQNL